MRGLRVATKKPILKGRHKCWKCSVLRTAAVRGDYRSRQRNELPQERLTRLLNLLISGEVGRLVITHKDRLLRFGAELVFSVCEMKSVEVVIINQGPDSSFEEDLAKDVLEIITVFSARLTALAAKRTKNLLMA